MFASPFASKLLTRTVSAAILLPGVLGAIYVGGLLFLGLVTVVLGLAAFEFVRLMEQKEYRPALLFTWGFVALGLFVARDPKSAETWLRPALAFLLGGALVWQFMHPGRSTSTVDWSLTVTGGLYVGWLGGHFVALREVPDGIRWLLMPLVVTWVSDTGAYLVGSAWGRHKLAPRLSPGKTWEGILGGWLTGVASGGLLAGLFGFGIQHGLAMGALVSVASPLGDLGISMIKREVGVKDSGGLIPGHGGMLDRIDSLLFTVTVGYYYVQALIF